MTRSVASNRGRAVGVALCAATAIAVVVSLPPKAAAQTPVRGTLETILVHANFYMLAGAGANIGVQLGDDGAVLVDAGADSTAVAVLAAIKALTPKPIRYIINTSAEADHVGGNAEVSRAGLPLSANPAAPGGANPAPIIGTEAVFLRMSAPTGQQSPYPTAAWPTETFTRKHKVLRVNDEGIEVIAVPAAHSDGDSLVFFRRSDVVVAGDVLDLTRFPVVDVEKGGSIQGEIAALNRVIDLAIPSIPQPAKLDGTRIVPGHGRVCEQPDVVDYRDMVTIVRDRVQDLMKSRLTLDQIQAAAPTQGWTSRYGAEPARQFIEEIYKSLAPTSTSRSSVARPKATAKGSPGAPKR